MPALDLNSDIELDNGTYRFVERDGNIVRLRSIATDKTRDMTLTELSRLATGLVPGEMFSVRDLNDLESRAKKKEKRRMDLLAAHVKELATGEPLHAGCDSRPEYDPVAHTKEERLKRKIAELNRLGIKVSRTTLQRQLAKFDRAGAAGLIDKRTTRKYAPLANLDPRLKDCFLSVIADRERRSTGTNSQLILNAAKEYRRRYGVDPEMPSRATLYRYLAAMTAGRHTTGSARTRQSLANRPKRTFAKVMASLPGEEVQVDSTKMDVLVRLRDGTTERPILTIAVDVATRSILASTIRLTATKAVDHALLIAHCLTPYENRPDRTEYRSIVSSQFPNYPLIEGDERRKLEQARAFVHPRRIQMDNGKDYASEVFLAALRKFGADATFSAPHTPTDKPIVERTFESINSMFTQSLPGYTGRSPEHRGYQVDKEDLLDVFMLYELFDDWVLRTWQNRAHEGLRDPHDPSIMYSPNQALRAASRVTSTLYLPLTPEDYIDLLPTRHMTITSTGVRLNNRYYDSPQLHPLRDQKSNDVQHAGKWKVKYDPYNFLVVWVVLEDGSLVECRLRNESQFDFPHAGDMFLIELDERLEVAASNAALNGAPAHESLTLPAAAPSSFTTDSEWEDADDELPDFDPDQDIYA
ncbi:Mu transposase C-terminal domain-containing protein [Leifsonia sp. C5G2]|uniref:Mu transposase C-terminal domain-containing protein n=1 Tax=Leifsonia sp. C5G2 TaxID=2735269 RepID=UPI0015855E8C|nr:Mu transposase C-terminal domain-containing protein [Leifsonia sp. C5G2]NUU06185.1 DDE-type integrase/transposase/recombinase [Leifsonia sp. C5G2]